MIFKKYKASELCDIQIGRTPPREKFEYFNSGADDYLWASIKDLKKCNKYIDETSETITKHGQQAFNIPIVKSGTVIASFKLTIGRVAIVSKDMLTNEAIAQFDIVKKDLLDRDYLYYLLKQYNWSSLGNTSSIGKAINSKIIKDMELSIPDLASQKKISSVLNSIDGKIDNNNVMAKLLIDEILVLYKHIFLEAKRDRKVCPVSKVFDISIGKTPPRKESQWFSSNKNDYKWISIADMGSSGLFIDESSECLTRDAVVKFNVPVVPENTVIFSFKLTLGRISITKEPMTTNEAIAHFKTNNSLINPYLYCYLKSFNFRELGSTSSIAKAINSKIIKEMPFVVPLEDELEKFNSIAIPLFDKIKALELESKTLSSLRDKMLTKIVSGEIDVSKVRIEE